jgi:glycosyltransferase involved in cell wall biosynthesis
MFTFVVTCYNQADVVLQTLESVKYQIREFGRGQAFQLIVTDDGSTDGSPDAIRGWLAGNGGLFARTDLLFREENGGICVNYAAALNCIEGERFIVVNGDDLLAPFDVFEITDRLDEADIVCTAFLKFTGSGDVIRAYGTYLEVVLQNFIRGKTLRHAVRLGCPVMGTAVYRKSLLSEEVLDFILKFRTVNDRACFQKILGEHEGARVVYVNRPFILYRISGTSISNFNSPTRLLHNKEVARLCRAEREREESAAFRLLLLWQEKSAYFRTCSNRFLRLLRFFSPYFAIMFWLWLRHHGEIVRMERELVDSHLEKGRAHCRRMEACAGESRTSR